MATGDRIITLLTAATASAAPSIADQTVGADIPFTCDQAVILVKSTAGSGTMTATLRLWAYQTEDDRWYDLGPLNGGSAIAEVSTADTISYAEGVAGLAAFDRLYCEITGALGGTLTAITVQAVCRRAELTTSN